MSIFDELEKIYTEIDSTYAGIEIAARARGHYKKEAAQLKKRELNDHAYFLFMFTRLEDRVRELSDELIDNKMATLSNWKDRRAWEVFDKKSLNFMNRVALLTLKGGPDYNLIKQYYDQRNKIGHGGGFTIAISMPTVVADMKRLFKSLKQ